MTRHPSRSLATTIARGVALAALVALASCGNDEPEAPERAYVPPPPPPLAPLEDLDMDPRVQFPQAREPSTRELAEGIAQLASAIVAGDDASLAEVLDDRGKRVLDDLTAKGLWDQSTKRIETVRVCALQEGESKTSCRLALGIQDPDGAYLLAWTGAQEGETWIFSPLPIDSSVVPQVAMLDDAPIAPPVLPGPVAFDFDPTLETITPPEPFKKND